MTNKISDSRSTGSVPTWLLITVCMTFAFGVAGGLVLANLATDTNSTMSTTSIISFTFTVALGAASIILAVLAITLSRSAEDALLKRSDEGIRLQSDVFVRTSEVLSHIQASTGVTEKRLEDIISGRTNVIAQEVFERSFPRGNTTFSAEDLDKLKRSLADSLKEELVPMLANRPSVTERRLSELEARQAKGREITDRWREFRQSVITELRKIDTIRIVSETAGDPGADTMEKFWDCLLDDGGRRVALDIHITDHVDAAESYTSIFKDERGRREFVRTIGWRAWEDKVDVLIWIWNEDISGKPAVNQMVELLRQSLRSTELVVLCGDPVTIAQSVVSHMKNATKQ